ncbi:MAG TPA: zinc ribbon domain-containing protein [Pyrinomonadaceae bacterium]|nr:zinc ribbon domain-containing protein [Pyrinomonadaceae bacterium]
MYCPRCGAQNIEDAKFCRGCGADIALVPQAMTGHLPETGHASENVVGVVWDPTGRRRRHRDRDAAPRLDKAVTNVFMGIGFLLVAFSVFLFAPAGRIWWFWMLIPSFSMLGGGIAEYVRFKQSKGEEIKLPGMEARKEMPPAPARVSANPQRNTAELVPQPPSVTEGTTRHLDLSAEAPTKHINVNDER